MTAIPTPRARPVAARISARIAAMADRWRAERALRTTYLRTLREMQALSDRDLADIGISRADIEDIARRHVYGD